MGGPRVAATYDSEQFPSTSSTTGSRFRYWRGRMPRKRTWQSVGCYRAQRKFKHLFTNAAALESNQGRKAGLLEARSDPGF